MDAALAQVIDVLPEPVLLVTDEGRVEYGNQSFRSWRGFDPQGQLLSDLVDDEHQIGEQLRRWGRSKQALPGALRLRTEGGSESVRCDGALLTPASAGRRAVVMLRMRPKREAVSPFLDLNRRLADLTSEVARRRRAESELEAQREWLRVTLASIGDGVIATDKAARIRFMNAAAEHYTGWSAPRAIGRPLAEVFVIVNEETREPAPSPVERALREGIIVGLANHTVLVRPDGTELAIADSAAPIVDGRGRTVGVVMAFQDETIRRFNERTRRELLGRERTARERAEEANRVKDEFLAVLSHELRTPLNAMLGWVELLRADEIGEEELQRGLEVIDRNAKDQLRLVEELLDVSRIASGRMDLEVSEVDLLVLVRAALESVDLAARAKDLDLRIEAPDERVVVVGDEGRLQQALWNVLSNAVKFSSRGGSVTVRVQRMRSRAAVVVRDTGVGLTEEQLEHLFEPFWQGHSATTRAHRGLGLGLSIVRRILEVHGGWVECASDGRDRGATFTLWLPIRAVVVGPEETESEGERKPSKPVPSRRLDGVRVLVVEDEEDARTLVGRVLTKRGADVCLAASAHEALSLLDRWRPDVILSDIAMPGVDGYAFIDAVRHRPPGRGGDVPAAALTAFAGETDRARALEAGFDRHVPKPALPETLVDVVAALAGRRS